MNSMLELLAETLLTGRTMRFGSTAKVLLKCKLKYYRISECDMLPYIPLPIQSASVLQSLHPVWMGAANW